MKSHYISELNKIYLMEDSLIRFINIYIDEFKSPGTQDMLNDFKNSHYENIKYIVAYGQDNNCRIGINHKKIMIENLQDEHEILMAVLHQEEQLYNTYDSLKKLINSPDILTILSRAKNNIEINKSWLKILIKNLENKEKTWTID